MPYVELGAGGPLFLIMIRTVRKSSPEIRRPRVERAQLDSSGSGLLTRQLDDPTECRKKEKENASNRFLETPKASTFFSRPPRPLTKASLHGDDPCPRRRDPWAPASWVPPPSLPPLEALAVRFGVEYNAACAKYRGLTARSNWILPHRLVCGGSPHDQLREIKLAGMTWMA